jgi:Tol biopolymer transport system component
VAFTAQKGLSREVYIMNAEGGNVRQLTNNGNQCSSLIFSPNGKKLFFVQRWYDDKLTPPLIEEIFSINVDGTYLKQLTHAREENAHNEKVLDITDYYVFYISVTYKYDNMPSKEQPNNHEVWQMMYDGSAQIQILGGGKTHGSYTSTKVLPNGKEIVFVDDSSNSFFYVLQVRELDDSGKTLQLTNDRVYSEISASPDGKYVAYMPLSRSEETRGIRIVSIDGKEFWTICENLNDK